MKNSKLRRALTLVACAVLLVCLSVGATLAYLTSASETVTNTFTVGKVIIDLDEAPVDANGDATTGDRVKQNSYKLLPGHEYDKDPTIHVDDESEDCYVYVEIVNEIAAIEDSANTIADQMTTLGWKAISGETNIFYKEEVYSAGDDIVVFNTFKIAGDDIDNTTLADYEGKTIVVKAYAIQKDGFNSATEAWTAAKSELTLLP